MVSQKIILESHFLRWFENRLKMLCFKDGRKDVFFFKNMFHRDALAHCKRADKNARGKNSK